MGGGVAVATQPQETPGTVHRPSCSFSAVRKESWFKMDSPGVVLEILHESSKHLSGEASSWAIFLAPEIEFINFIIIK